MRFQVIVKPNARTKSVEKLATGEIRVSVKAPATEGRANDAVIEALADHFRVPKSHVRILHGERGRKKLVEILIPARITRITPKAS